MDVRRFAFVILFMIAPSRQDWANKDIGPEAMFTEVTLKTFNNCKVTRIVGGHTGRSLQSTTLTGTISPHRYPLLNCTQTSFTNFNISRVPTDVREMLFQSDVLPAFRPGDLRPFENLTSLQLRGDQVPEFVSKNSGSKENVTNIEKLAISDTALNQIPVSFLRNFPNLAELILTHDNIRTVNDEDFLGLTKLQALSIGHNPLSMLHMGWISTIRTLTVLNLRATKLVAIPPELNTTNSIRHLDLSDNSIEKIEPLAFSGTSQLTTLLLSNNRIQSIHKDALKGAYNIRYIDLTANNIERITANIFTQLPADGLSVSLWENKIHCDGQLRWLPEWIKNLAETGSYPDICLKCFNPARNHGKRLKDMQVSDFTSNDEEPYEECINRGEDNPTTPTSTSTAPSTRESTENTPLTKPAPTEEEESKFQRLCPSQCKCYYKGGYKRKGVSPYPVVDCSNARYSKLPLGISLETKTLLLSGNNLETLDFVNLKGLQRLEHLHVDRNAITNIECTFDECILENLSHFSISRNKLNSIPSELMRNFPKLSSLGLHNNRITEIPAKLFLQNSLLEELDLGTNPLQKPLDAFLFAGIQLKTLSLRGLGLHNVPSCIKKQSTMVRLDMSNNNISVFAPEDFEGFSSLLELSLDNNKLSYLPHAAFSKMPDLISVDLSENRLSALHPGSFLDASSTLRHIELWENPLRCDCDLRWLKDWFIHLEENNPLTEIHFRCDQPSRVHGMTSGRIAEIDFTCQPDDKDYNGYHEEQSCVTKIYSSKDMGVAVFLTLILTVCVVFLLKGLWRMRHSSDNKLGNGISFKNRNSALSVPLVSLDDI